MSATVSTVELFFYWLGATSAIAALPMVARNANRDRRFWNDILRKPTWAPRSTVVFSVVWTILYVLQAFAATRIRGFGAWQSGINLGALVVYVVLQFALASYTFLLFNLRSLWASTTSVAVSLVLAIIETVFAFRLDTLSGIVFVVLDVWLVYALALSISIWVMTNGDKVVRNRTRTQIVC